MRNSNTSGPPKAPSVTDGRWNSPEISDDVEYHDATDSFRVSFDSTADSLSMAIVSTVAVVSETDPAELSPIYDAIDPDPLGELVDRHGAKPSKSDVHITFNYEGFTVSVHSYGVITIGPPEEASTEER